MFAFPKMLRVRQKFPKAPPLDIEASLRAQFAAKNIFAGLHPGDGVAITAGSRGITNLAKIVGTVVKLAKESQLEPFIVPAMGSHGGATPEGQLGILADYGVTPATMGAPIRAGMGTRILGTTADGVPVHFSTEALNARGIIVLNRIKPHTDFVGGKIASGMMKMIAIGLAKRNGAVVCHAAGARIGLERVVLGSARIALANAPILGAIGIVENQTHDTALIQLAQKDEIEAIDAALLIEARKRMPSLPFNEMDLLIIDRMGKNISGTGMDTNIIGRDVHGYSSSLVHSEKTSPLIRRLVVRELTTQTHGNAVGVGMADFVTKRLVDAINKNTTYINSLTAMTPQLSKIPIHFDTDREVIEKAVGTLALKPGEALKCIRIADTLSLEEVLVSEAYAHLIAARGDLEILSDPAEMDFGSDGNLPPL